MGEIDIERIKELDKVERLERFSEDLSTFKANDGELKKGAEIISMANDKGMESLSSDISDSIEAYSNLKKIPEDVIKLAIIVGSGGALSIGESAYSRVDALVFINIHPLFTSTLKGVFSLARSAATTEKLEEEYLLYFRAANQRHMTPENVRMLEELTYPNTYFLKPENRERVRSFVKSKVLAPISMDISSISSVNRLGQLFYKYNVQPVFFNPTNVADYLNNEAENYSYLRNMMRSAGIDHECPTVFSSLASFKVERVPATLTNFRAYADFVQTIK